MKKVLITGGAGYIGSHTVVELINQKYEVVILDNFSNSSIKVLSKIKQITGVEPALIQGDIRDKLVTDELFEQHNFASVIHFAGLKAVGESVEKPLRYYQNNVQGSLCLFRTMADHGCFNLVFSSSATVYGDPESVPITEEFPLSATNPYGQSKLMVEEILRDLAAADKRWNISILRYFNPVAAHSSGLIGEDPNGIPNNLLPYISQVAVGRLEQLSVFGDDYDTPDGTGVRDYIHVVDLADAHINALQKLANLGGCRSFNIGTGNGYSVLEMINAFEQASGKTISYAIKPRRPGDISSCYADANLANNVLGWRAKFSLDQMMKDLWRWQSKNPDGYK